MNLQTIYKQYTPNFWGLVVFHAASIYFPKLSPALGIWYHPGEIANNFQYTESLSKQIEVQLPYESETQVISVQGELNILAFMSNFFGLIVSIVELGALICMTDTYVANTFRGIMIHGTPVDISHLLIQTKALNLQSFIYGFGSYAFFTHKEYNFVDARTGISIDPYYLSDPKTKILGLYKPQSESIIDDISSTESSDEIISTELVQQEEIEPITSLSS